MQSSFGRSVSQLIMSAAGGNSVREWEVPISSRVQLRVPFQSTYGKLGPRMSCEDKLTKFVA